MRGDLIGGRTGPRKVPCKRFEPITQLALDRANQSLPPASVVVNPITGVTEMPGVGSRDSGIKKKMRLSPVLSYPAVFHSDSVEPLADCAQTVTLPPAMANRVDGGNFVILFHSLARASKFGLQSVGKFTREPSLLLVGRLVLAASGAFHCLLHNQSDSVALIVSDCFRGDVFDLPKINRMRGSTIEELSSAKKIDVSYVRRMLRLNSLAPDIVEAILMGHGAESLSLRQLHRGIPVSWITQREL